MNTDYVEIKVTLESYDDAEHMAGLLVNKRLVAQANLIKMNYTCIESGGMSTQKGTILSCITRLDMYNVVRGFVETNCVSAFCPIICTPILEITKDYAQWIDDAIR